MSGTGPSSDPQKCQVGAWKQGDALFFVELSDQEVADAGDAGAPQTLILFKAAYTANQIPGYPMRAGAYNAGDVALMPAVEAARLVAAGGASVAT